MLTNRAALRKQLPLLVGGGIIAVLLGRELVPTIDAPQVASRGAIALLLAGDAKICASPEVEQIVKSIVRPEHVDVAQYRIVLTAASLDAFDQAVSKASCNANLAITAPDGAVVSDSSITYAVLPSASDPQSIVVRANVGMQSQALAERAQNDLAADAERQQQEATDRQLRTTVTTKWLQDRWVTMDAGSDACTAGEFFEYLPGGQLATERSALRWRLDGLELRLIAPTKTLAMTIVEADASSFTVEDGDGSTALYRRCTEVEMEPAHGHEPIEPTPPAADRSSFQDPS